MYALGVRTLCEEFFDVGVPFVVILGDVDCKVMYGYVPIRDRYNTQKGSTGL